MTYPSVLDREYFNIWHEDAAGNRYEATDEGPPAGVVLESTYVSFALDVREKVFAYGQGDLIIETNTSYSDTLALALSRMSMLERLRSLWRTWCWMPTTSLAQAVKHACRCERCTNALAYAYGLAWERSRTCCEACKYLEQKRA